MPLFYTHLKNDTGVICDNTGRQFASDDEAIAEAARTAAGILAEELAGGRETVTITLDVEHADHAPAGTIRVEARIDRPA